MDWNTVFKKGGVTARLLSLVWQLIEKMVNFLKIPSLIIADKNIGKYTYQDVGY